TAAISRWPPPRRSTPCGRAGRSRGCCRRTNFCERAGSAARGGPRLRPGLGSPRIPVGRELFPHDLPDRIESRATMNVLEQRVVDQSLVVAATSPIHCGPKELDHCVVQANRDLCLPRLGSDYGSSLRAREIDLPVLLSDGPFHTLAPDGGSPSRPRSPGLRQVRGRCRSPRSGAQSCSAAASRIVL